MIIKIEKCLKTRPIQIQNDFKSKTLKRASPVDIKDQDIRKSPKLKGGKKQKNKKTKRKNRKINKKKTIRKKM